MIKWQHQNRSRQGYFPKLPWLIIFYIAFVRGIEARIRILQLFLCIPFGETLIAHNSFICILLLVVPLGSLSPSGNKQMLLPILISSSSYYPLVQQSCRDQSWVSMMNSCIFCLSSYHPDQQGKVFWHFPPLCSDMRDVPEFFSSLGNLNISQIRGRDVQHINITSHKYSREPKLWLVFISHSEREGQIHICVFLRSPPEKDTEICSTNHKKIRDL